MLLPFLLALAALQDPVAAILGRWEGTSTCIRADWNRACHDEVVRYDVVRDSLRPGVLIHHAYKRVGTEWEWMGDLDLRYDAAGGRWAGEFSNSRVHIEWSFWRQGADLAGKVIDLPGGRQARDVLVHRPAPAPR